ncbi:MAG: YdbH domain-containing protein, partial [Opitutales bacterium]
AIDGSDVNPWAWAVYRSQTEVISAPATLRLPVEHLQVEGQIILAAAALADRPVNVRFEAQRTAGDGWSGNLRAATPGFALQGEGRYDPVSDRLDYRITAATLELKAWQDYVQRAVLLPGGFWELEGRLNATAEGHYAGKRRGATGRVQLTDARLINPARGVTIDGLTAGLEFTDFLHLRSSPGNVRVRELRSGDLVLTDLELTVAFEGFERMAVSRATLSAFGGRLAAEPFRVFPAQQELAVVLVAEGLDMARLLTATHDVPARATGRVDGRLPLRLDSAGLRLGTGWLELQRGTHAEVQFNAPGLLTSGLSPGAAGYVMLRKVETGLLRLRVDEMRLDLRPPGGPPGRMAVLHLAGEPAGPALPAPVVFEVNIDGPVEQHLNLGFDSRVRFNPVR